MRGSALVSLGWKNSDQKNFSGHEEDEVSNREIVVTVLSELTRQSFILSNQPRRLSYERLPI